MRVIFVILFWMIILIVFNALDFPSKVEKDVLDVYLKEYYTRILFILRDTIIEKYGYLLKSGCNNDVFLEKIREFYKNYKLEDITSILGIWVENSSQESCWMVKGDLCLCGYYEFSKVLTDETIEAENLRTVEIEVNKWYGNIKINKIIIWYYK